MSDYKFTVRCTNGTAKIVEWRTGDVDPGKEYLRMATGTAHPDCSVQEFNPATDIGLPIEVKEGAGAIATGLGLLTKLFGF